MLGFHDSYMIQQMLNNVDFHPFTICLYNITIIIASIPDNNYCMKGLQLVLCIKQSVIWQKIKGGLFSISIFQDGEMVKQFKDITAASSLIHGVYDDINHETNMHELWEWRVMLEAIGCKNITPFERDVSDMEFWNRAKEPKEMMNLKIIKTLQMFFGTIHYVKVLMPILMVQMEKCRNFTYEELQQVSPKTVNTAREHHHKNGPGCKVLDEPIIVRK
ncbi:hypothetical protein RhiirA4_474651 [Rhizophagus irregularis]|uniref:Uncharacterized protein n=1 Tax=Rhizophagus irregularis TaxID=588596 RepID=A0A2I1H8W5_9GLOM|nr:hypothetical protein RhiirA4_474651 [Rhizophagus irregularis]